MDDFNAKSDEVQNEKEDKIIELEEMVNNNLEYSEMAPSKLAQPKKECDYVDYYDDVKIGCSSTEDCKQCMDCPEGSPEVFCDLNFDFDSDGPFCQCDEYIILHSMDDFNAKSEEVQSENE